MEQEPPKDASEIVSPAESTVDLHPNVAGDDADASESKDGKEPAKPADQTDECARLWRAGDKAGAAAAHYALLAAAERSPEARAAFAADYDLHAHNAKYLPAFRGATGAEIIIFGATIPGLGCWDPSWVEKGLTGSEEAVVYAAAVLARRGFRVTVCMDPPARSLWRLPTMNPRYVNVNEFLAAKSAAEAAAAIFWRHTRFDLAKERARKVFLWPHDLMGKFNTQGLDGIFYLSEYHKAALVAATPALASVPGVIAGNGIVLEQFAGAFEPAGLHKPAGEDATTSNPQQKAAGEDAVASVGERKLRAKAAPHSCVYASNYSRGLALLVDIWPAVRREVPDATLDIYYGRETWGTMAGADLKALVAKIEALKGQGVREVGSVGHQALADAFCAASILAYPNSTLSETFCITVVKAQYAGMIPVCGLTGALAETCAPWAPTLPAGADAKAFERVLIGALKSAEAFDRSGLPPFAARWTWDACVDKWLSLMKIETPTP